MRRGNIILRRIQSERGSNVAQAAAAALLTTALLSAMLSLRAPLSQRIVCSFETVIASISGGSAASCGPTNSTPPQPPQPPVPPKPPTPPKKKPTPCDSTVMGMLDTLIPKPSCTGDTTTGTIKVSGDVTIPTPWVIPVKVGANGVVVIARTGDGKIKITVQDEQRAGVGIVTPNAGGTVGSTTIGAGAGPEGSGVITLGSGQTVQYDLNNPGEACAAAEALAYLMAKKGITDSTFLNNPIAKPIVNSLLDQLEKNYLLKGHWFSRSDSLGFDIKGSLMEGILKGEVGLNGKGTLTQLADGYQIQVDGELSGAITGALKAKLGDKASGQYQLEFDQHGNLRKVTIVGQVNTTGNPTNGLTDWLKSKIKLGPGFESTVGVKVKWTITDPAQLAAISEALRTGNPGVILGTSIAEAITNDKTDFKVICMTTGVGKLGFKIGLGDIDGAELEASLEASRQEEQQAFHHSYDPQTGQTTDINGCG